MTKTEITKIELEELLADEPDTKLKKKLLAMLESEQDELTEFHEFMQSVMDSLTTTLGKRRIVIPAEKQNRYGGEYWNSVNAGKCTLTVEMCLDYIEQAHIRIYDGHKELYSAVEIRIRRDNPKAATELAKLTVDYLNGDQQ